MDIDMFSRASNFNIDLSKMVWTTKRKSDADDDGWRRKKNQLQGLAKAKNQKSDQFSWTYINEIWSDRII